MKRLTIPEYEAEPGGGGYRAINGEGAASTMDKETVFKNAFPGTQGLNFPPAMVMYVLDVERGVLVHAYIPVTFFPATGGGDFKETHG
jgi:hypothetical protein